MKDTEIKNLSSDFKRHQIILTRMGFEYVCQIRDVVSSVVFAHIMSEHMHVVLVLMPEKANSSLWIANRVYFSQQSR